MNAHQRRQQQRIAARTPGEEAPRLVYGRRMSPEELHASATSGRPSWGMQIGYDSKGPIVLAGALMKPGRPR